MNKNRRRRIKKFNEHLHRYRLSRSSTERRQRNLDLYRFANFEFEPNSVDQNTLALNTYKSILDKR